MARSVVESAMGDLGPRTLSALALAPVALGATYYGSPWFEAAVAVGSAVAVFEWARLALGRNPGADFGLAATFVVGAVVAQSMAWPFLGLALLGLGAIAVFAVSFWTETSVRLGRVGWALGVPLVGLPAVALIWLRAEPAAGRGAVLWLLAVVWAVDIGAYAFGRWLGGPRLAVAVSPSKTWAGFWGGLACGGATGLAVASLLGRPADAALAATSLGIGIVAQVGDLGESWIKRRVGAKDSGGLIPGHGGLLDRIDGLWMAAVALALLTLVGGRVV